LGEVGGQIVVKRAAGQHLRPYEVFGMTT
jgi:hypothetical protein